MLPSENTLPSTNSVPGLNNRESVKMAARSHVMVHYRPGVALTAKAGEALEAGTFVKFDGEWDDRRNPNVLIADADSVPAGFVRRDTESGDYITVDRGQYVVDLQADGAITAGDPIGVGTNGAAKVATDAASTVGFALSATSADGYVSVAVN